MANFNDKIAKYPFISDFLTKYYKDSNNSISAEQKYKSLCSELGKYFNNKKIVGYYFDKESSDTLAGWDYWVRTPDGTKTVYTSPAESITSQFIRVINREKYDINIFNRNKLFVYALLAYIEENNIEVEKLYEVKTEKKFDVLFYLVFGTSVTIESKGNPEINRILSYKIEAAKFIFGAENSSINDIKKSIVNDDVWKQLFSNIRKKEEYHRFNNFDYIGEVAIDVLKTALKQPLFRLSLNKWAEQGKYSDEYKTVFLLLLKHSIRVVENNEYYIVPATHALLNHLNNTVHEMSKIAEYTERDIISLYGELACVASNDNGIFSISKIQTKIPGLKKDIEVLDNYHSRFIKRYDSSHMQFFIKPYRIAFKAIANSRAVNSLTEFDVKLTFKKIEEIASLTRNNKSDLVNLDSGYFEDVIIYSSIFISCLDERKRDEFISYVLKQSENYKVANRPRQILAIYILTIILSENASVLTYSQRKEIFLHTYGQTAYKLLSLESEYLFESSPFYKNAIKEVFDNNFNGEDEYETLTTNYQPLYFFWYDTIFSRSTNNYECSKEILDYAAKSFELRKKYWETNDYDLDKNAILGLINEGIALKKEIDVYTNPPEARLFAYSICALLYTISNIVNYGETRSAEIKNAVYDTLAENTLFLDLIFFSDYIIRSSNKIYVEKYEFGKPLQNLYLLCGTFRFFSAIGHKDDIKKYNLDYEQRTLYKKCLEKEHGSRYYFLLSYALSFTDYYNQEENNSLKTTILNTNDCKFLPYDRLEYKRIFENTTDIKKWRSISGK